jgi:hypothetical protein
MGQLAWQEVRLNSPLVTRDQARQLRSHLPQLQVLALQTVYDRSYAAQPLHVEPRLLWSGTDYTQRAITSYLVA